MDNREIYEEDTLLLKQLQEAMDLLKQSLDKLMNQCKEFQSIMKHPWVIPDIPEKKSQPVDASCAICGKSSAHGSFEVCMGPRC